MSRPFICIHILADIKRNVAVIISYLPLNPRLSTFYCCPRLASQTAHVTGLYQPVDKHYAAVSTENATGCSAAIYPNRLSYPESL